MSLYHELIIDPFTIYLIFTLHFSSSPFKAVIKMIIWTAWDLCDSPRQWPKIHQFNLSSFLLAQDTARFQSSRILSSSVVSRLAVTVKFATGKIMVKWCQSKLPNEQEPSFFGSGKSLNDPPSPIVGRPDISLTKTSPVVYRSIVYRS